MCIFSVFLLAGCEPSEEVKNDLFIAMRKEDIISDNFTQIDSVSYSRWSFEMCKTDKYYIYKDNKSNMIAIKYEKLIGSNEEYDNLVTNY